ncbi:ATP-grasp domain-containing protein [Xenorhabdus sp. 18]|uniref:ATP-grasp domain-containing protein n=1 Tax=Xenorhabdus doucetiae TaxID=351671 RepID=UPI0019979DEF|nr:ATP-grasp domain-containing protein [Xenorhabdus sp. 18]MBD2796148.1 ATP-grasp domain-containing protein [Xenorhabdus sp. 18]
MAFLETNASGTGVEAIRKLQHAGYHVLFLTQEIEFYQSLELNPLEVADIVIEVNTNCIGSILNRLANFELHGVVAFDDYRLITAAFVARHLGLPHPSIDGLIHCRFKNLTRQVVSSGNVDYQVCELKAPLDDGTVPYPCVVKPCDDNGSVGVRICQNAEDLHKAVAALKEQRINARGYRLSSQYLIEAFVEGQEYSAELIWNTTSNDWQLLGVTEKHITSGSYAVEVGHDFPVMLPEYQEVETTIHGWLNEAGLSHTVAHVEFKLSSHGMALIEINPRPGGDMIHLLCQLSTGIAEQVAIEQTTLKALNLLGVRWGATHTEVMSGSKGVHIIETHLRPGGDEIPELLLLVEEHCQYKLAIEALISGTLLPTPRHPKGSAAIHFFS